MQISTLRRSRKNQAWMQDCKQLILDLSNALTAKNAQNQKMAQQIKEMEKTIGMSISREEQLKKKLTVLESTFRREEESKSKKELELSALNQQLRKEMELTLRQKQLVQKSNEQLQSALRSREVELAEFDKAAKKTKNQLNQSHTHIQFLKNEVQTLRGKLQGQERQHREEIQRLKELNIDIKKHFQIIQQDYSSALRENQDQKSVFARVATRKQKNTMEKKQFTTINEFRERGLSENRKNGEPWVANPEMSAELIKIQRQIANQYTRFSQTRETVMKQRVSKTLQNIQTILTDMSCRFQEDSSSYE